jgi:hypothetical protein
MAEQDRKQETETASRGEGAQLGRTRSESSPPPGAGVLNSDGSATVASENAVQRLNRDAGDVLADETLNDRDGERA